MDDLYRPMFLPDLLIAGLERNGQPPAVHIGGEMLTAHQMRDEISRYVQAFDAQGMKPGGGVATLSKNRVEVLFSMGAVMVSGCRNTHAAPARLARGPCLRPRGRRHRDAPLRSAFADVARRAAASGSRAAAAAVVRRGIGRRRPDGARRDVRAAAPRRPGRGRRGPVGSRLHRWHDRQAQGRDEHVPGQRGDGADHGLGLAVARRGTPPRLHAAEPRRRVVVRPGAAAGRLDVRAADVRGGRGARGDRAPSHHDRDARPVDDLRAPRPPEVRRDRPLEPADHLLRRVAHVAGSPAGGDHEDGADLLPVLRADGGGHDRLRPAQGGAPRRRPGAARRRAVARFPGSASRCSTTTATRCRRASPASCASAARS